MISGHRPPKKPLGEVSASDADADRLATSERVTDDLLAGLAECERRLKQSSDYAVLLKASTEDTEAAAKYTQEETNRCAPGGFQIEEYIRK